ncbi:MAG: hypothetical protein MI742_17525 [Desulfobacterales bacterium]|nr:hypothetical protein [Desulfobacterales bacterium]
MATVQFIAYQLRTATMGDPRQKDYPGLADPRADLHARCRVLADAMHATLKSPTYNPLAVKIFVAPEFFFRGGRAGAYDIGLISDINGIMDSYVSGPMFKNWIMFMGTAIGSLPGEDPDSMEVFNISLVRKGGVKVAGKVGPQGLASQDKDSVLIYKEYVSFVDFQGQQYGSDEFYSGPQAGQAHLKGKQVRLQGTSGGRDAGGSSTPVNVHGQTAYTKKGAAYTISEDSATGLGGGSIFQMGGFNFVTEICLDHLQKRARSARPKKTHFHIVTSCGMTPKYSVAATGGFFFLVDGMDYDPDQRVSLRLKRGPKKLEPQRNWDYVNMMDRANWKYQRTDGYKMFENGRGAVCLSQPYRMVV